MASQIMTVRFKSVTLVALYNSVRFLEVHILTCHVIDKYSQMYMKRLLYNIHAISIEQYLKAIAL